MRHRLHAVTAACGLAVTTPATIPVRAQTPPASYPATAPTQPLSSAQDPILLQKLDLLRQRIAERDQLQREIDQLIVETRTPQAVQVFLEFMEVNLTAAERLGIAPAVGGAFTPSQLEDLRQRGAIVFHSRPQLMGATGETLRMQTTNSETGAPLGTTVELQADSLGANRVRIAVHAKNQSKAEKSSKTPEVPHTLEIDTQFEAAFGETKVFQGLLMNRTQTRRGALGRVTETIQTEAILVVRVEPILPRAAQVAPATVFSPR
jgi:hypothetical protein